MFYINDTVSFDRLYVTQALEEKQWWDGILPVFLFNLTGLLGLSAHAALVLRMILLSIIVLEDHKLQERKIRR